MTRDRDSREANLVAHPDDRAAHAAYADWLTEHGDPRGEFIQVQLALEDETQTPENRSHLREVEKALLARHGIEWLGGLAPFVLEPADNVVNTGFARGWLDRLEISNLKVPFAEALANAPQTRLLRSLRILVVAPPLPRQTGEPIPTNQPWPLGILAQSPHLQNVRWFQLGSEGEVTPDDNGLVGGRDRDRVGLVRRFSRLEELYFNADLGNAAELYGLETFTRLRVLHVRGLRDDVDAVAENPALRRLIRLSIDPYGRDDELSLEGVRRLLHARHLRRLTHLRLHRCENGDRLCRMIVRSPLLPQLKELGLLESRISIRGAGVLADCEEIAGLELLDLSRNYLGRRGVSRLARAGVNYLADNQRRPDDDYYDGVQE
jgi:uncharacterized protein (TIGR02996 family)